MRSKRAAEMRQVFRSVGLHRLLRMRRALAGSSSTHVMRKPSSSSDKKPLSTGERGKVVPTSKPGEIAVDGDEKEGEPGTTNRREKGKKERKGNNKLRNGRGKGNL